MSYGQDEQGEQQELAVAPIEWSEVDEYMAGNVHRTASLLDIVGLLHDDMFVMKQQLRALVQWHLPRYYSDNPDDHLASYAAPPCPKCGKVMMLREAKRGGEFWGCIDYSLGKCNGTMSLDVAERMARGEVRGAERPEDVEGETNEF